MPGEDQISVREFEGLKQEMAALRANVQSLLVELGKTQTMIRDYNGLREAVEGQKQVASANMAQISELVKTVAGHDETLKSLAIKKKFLGNVWANTVVIASLAISGLSFMYSFFLKGR